MTVDHAKTEKFGVAKNPQRHGRLQYSIAMVSEHRLFSRNIKISSPNFAQVGMFAFAPHVPKSPRQLGPES